MVQNSNSTDHFGFVVKSARQAKELTQSQLAERLSITERYLKAIENSGRNPSYNLLVRIIHELEIPTDIVFYPEQNKNNSSNKLIPLWKEL